MQRTRASAWEASVRSIADMLKLRAQYWNLSAAGVSKERECTRLPQLTDITTDKQFRRAMGPEVWELCARNSGFGVIPSCSLARESIASLLGSQSDIHESYD